MPISLNGRTGIVSTGNIVTGNYFIGDGTYITNVHATGDYSNSNVQAYLPTYSGDIANLTVTGNLATVTAANGTATTQVATTAFVQNAISAAPGMYGDANVEALLSSGTLANNIVTTGNVTGAFIIGDGSQLTNLPAGGYSNANVESFLASGLDTSNIITTANVSGSYFLGNGAFLTGLPATYGNADVSNYLASGTDTANIITTGNVSGTYILGNGSQLTGMYGNTQVSDYLASGTDTQNIVTTANIQGGTLLTSDLILSGNDIASLSNIIIDPLNDGSPLTGNVTVLGNLQVSGNVTYTNYDTSLTANLLWVAAANAGSSLAASGGGLAVGNAVTPYATFTYNEPANVWSSNLGVSAAGNVTAPYFIGDGSQLTGLYGNADVSNYLASGTDTANIITTGNVSGTYFLGNGAFLTGLPAAYGNADVSNYLASGTDTANIITTANVSAGYFLGNGALLTGIAANYGNANVAEYLASFTVTTPIATTDNMAARIFYGDNFTTNPGADGYLEIYQTEIRSVSSGDSGNITINPQNDGVTGTGNVNILSNVYATGNVSAPYFLGDGSQLTNLPAGNYGNANVSAYLASGLDTANITTTGNVNAAYLWGDGSNITNLPAGNYGNANVEALLESGTLANNIITTGNVSAANVNVSSIADGEVVFSDNGLLVGNSNFTWDNANATLNVAQINSSGNSTLAGLTVNSPGGGYFATLTGQAAPMYGGAQTWRFFSNNAIAPGAPGSWILFPDTSTQLTAYPGTYDQFTGIQTLELYGNISAGNIGNTATYLYGDGSNITNIQASSIIGAYGDANVELLLETGISNNIITTGNISAGNASVTGNLSAITAANGTATTQAATTEFVQNALLNGYGNANVSAYLASGDDNANIITTANISATVIKTIGADQTIISGNVIATTSNTIIDPLNDGSALTGDVTILGNLSVTGNITYTDYNSSLTANALWIAAANATAPVQASGGGLAVGNTFAPYATFTYNQPANVWSSNLGMTAAGNVTAPYFIGDGSQLTGMYGNANVADYLASGTDTANIITTANVSGANIIASYFWGDGSNITNVPLANSIVNGTSNVSIPVADGNINFGVNGSLAGHLSTNGAVAFGVLAGQNTIGANIVAVGYNAGGDNQGAQAVAIGLQAGNASQGTNSVAIGSGAGKTTQGQYAVAIGSNAGGSSQGNQSIAIGLNTGGSQGTNSVAIGTISGSSNQGQQATAVGYGTGQSSQGQAATAIGLNAGTSSQGANAVAVGSGAGTLSQSASAVAIGLTAGGNAQGASAIAIGAQAGGNLQGSLSVAIGVQAGNTTQGSQAVAIGQAAGQTGQKQYGIAIGPSAGGTNQGLGSIALGLQAGLLNQGNTSIAIGYAAAQAVQSANAVSIGSYAGNAQTSQGAGAIALGAYAAQVAQGTNSIAIGFNAVANSQIANSIALNASGSQITASNAGFYVNPVRNDTGNVTNAVYYNTATNELTYGPGGGGSSGNIIFNGTSNVSIPASNGSINFAVNGNPSGSLGSSTVAFGLSAGANSQSTNAVALGRSSGQNSQGVAAVSVGYFAGQTSQGDGAVALGVNAGASGQGSSSIAIGSGAGYTNQASNTIILNATGTPVSGNPGQTDSFYVNPVRNDTGNITNVLYYNTTSNEITYGPVANSTAIVNGTSSVFIPSAGGGIGFTVGGTGVGNILASSTSLPIRNDTGSVSQVLYYNASTKEVTYSSPLPSGPYALTAPFAGGALPSSAMNGWVQVQGNTTLPSTTGLTGGSFVYLMNAAGGPVTITVNNTGSEFIYYPPNLGSTNRSIVIYPGQWIMLVARGSVEWDVGASNYYNASRSWCPPTSGPNTVVSLDSVSFRVQSDSYLYIGNPTGGSVSYSYGGIGLNASVALTSISSSVNLTSGSYSTTGCYLWNTGNSAQLIVTDTTNNRTYRVNAQRPNGSGATFAISIERIAY